MRLESLTRFANIAFNPSRTTINTNHLEFGRQGLATMVPLLAKTVGFSYIYSKSQVSLRLSLHSILTISTACIQCLRLARLRRYSKVLKTLKHWFGLPLILL